MNRSTKNKCDVHFFTDFDEYEFIKRVTFDLDLSIAEATRLIWFPPKWLKRLEAMRKAHRKSGLADYRFLHKKQIKQEGKK